MTRLSWIVAIVATTLLSSVAIASECDLHDATGVPRKTEAYFGDVGLFTSYSFSAYFDGIRTMPDEAYRFARGEPVKYKGRVVQRSTAPLDFIALTDQVEYL